MLGKPEIEGLTKSEREALMRELSVLRLEECVGVSWVERRDLEKQFWQKE